MNLDNILEVAVRSDLATVKNLLEIYSLNEKDLLTRLANYHYIPVCSSIEELEKTFEKMRLYDRLRLCVEKGELDQLLSGEHPFFNKHYSYLTRDLYLKYYGAVLCQFLGENKVEDHYLYKEVKHGLYHFKLGAINTRDVEFIKKMIPNPEEFKREIAEQRCPELFEAIFDEKFSWEKYVEYTLSTDFEEQLSEEESIDFVRCLEGIVPLTDKIGIEHLEAMAMSGDLESFKIVYEKFGADPSSSLCVNITSLELLKYIETQTEVPFEIIQGCSLVTQIDSAKYIRQKYGKFLNWKRVYHILRDNCVHIDIERILIN